MGIIATNKNQITFIYNSNSSLGKQALAYANATKIELISIDTSKTKVSSTQWIEIANKLDIQIAELISKKHPDFMKLYDHKVNLETDDWLKIIRKQPHLVVFPIFIIGANYFQIKNPSKITNHIDDYLAKRPRDPRSNKN